MIQVLVNRDAEKAITEVKVEGHAGYAEIGQDLVCAAVSAITFGTANAIEALLGIETVQSIDESGFLHFKLPHIEDNERHKQVQLLMEAMLVSLHTVADSYTDEVDSYSEYIQVIDNQ